MQHISEIAAGIALELLFVVIAVAVLYRVWGWFSPVPKRQFVQAFQSGAILKDGKIEKIVGPGSYWVVPGRLVLCDMRPVPFQVPDQELLTADNMRIRVGVAGEYRITDPTSFISQSSDSFAKFYLELRQALRMAISETMSENLFPGQGQLTSRIKELLQPHEAQLGIQLTQLNVYEAIPLGWLREV
jgi:regulator of protease activity HflC (stomatin/prohibitin superfamily)